MKNKIKIGINGRFLARKYTGIGRYTINLFYQLAVNFDDIDLVFAVPRRPDPDVMKLFENLPNVRIVVIPEKIFLAKISAGLAKSYWERWQLSRFFAQEKIDLLHLPYPCLTRAPGKAKSVTTIHDTIPWTVEEYKNNSWLGRLYNAVALRLAAQADQIITVSKTSAEEIAKLKVIPPQKLKVVYNACAFQKKEPIEPYQKVKVLEKYGINPLKPYLFYLGGYDKRKNVKRLVEIFLSKVSDNLDIQLVLGGAKVLQNKLFEDLDEVKYSIANNEKVILTGFVEEKDLPFLYGTAAAFISLSKVEGFNLNLLEALSLNTPVIISDLEVHREIAGDWAVLVDLEKSNREIGEIIVNLLKDKKHYNGLREKVSQFVSSFSWEKSAKEIHEIYLNLINRKQNAV